MTSSAPNHKAEFYKPLLATIDKLAGEFRFIPEDRKPVLQELSSFVQKKIEGNQNIELVFICTHNSRRSHIAQIWAQAAAAYYGIPRVLSYSGGTEATAFNPRAVKAMEKVGFKIRTESGTDNPIYRVSFSPAANEVTAYSKRYDDDANPKKNFAAVMTCSHADENCPVVSGMEQRISLPYNDPKEFDGTDLESAKYSERVNEIGREILYAFSLVKPKPVS